jgi:hypothetical protein
MAETKLAPLSTQVPIVDQNGNPTPYFQQLMQIFIDEKNNVADDVIENLEDVTVAIDAVQDEVDALEGVVAALELDDLADVDTTGVSDGDVLAYDNASSEWVAAAPTAGSGGYAMAQPRGTPGSNDAGAFATLTNAFVLAADVEVNALFGMFNAANIGDVYNMFIAEVNNSGTISSTVATGASAYTTVATGSHYKKFALSSPVTLTAGTNYILALVTTNGATNKACRAYTTSEFYLALPLDFTAMNANLGGLTKRFWYTQNSSSPSSGSAAGSSVTSTQYQLGMSFALV